MAQNWSVWGVGLIVSPPAVDRYRTFVLEERFGLNNQTLGLFFADMVKKSLLSGVIGLPIMSLLVYIIRSTGDLFWLCVGAAGCR